MLANHWASIPMQIVSIFKLVLGNIVMNIYILISTYVTHFSCKIYDYNHLNKM